MTVFRFPRIWMGGKSLIRYCMTLDRFPKRLLSQRLFECDSFTSIVARLRRGACNAR